MASVLTLSCGKCGAPLTVQGASRYLTCTFCGARLEVRHEGGAAYAAVLERLEETAQRLTGDVERLRLQGELERLDREHEVAVRSAPGRGTAGATGGGPGTPIVLIGALVVTFGLAWTVAAWRMGAGPLFAAFGVLFVVFALYVVGRGLEAQRRATALEAGYQRRRAELLERLEGHTAPRDTPLGGPEGDPVPRPGTAPGAPEGR